MHDKIVIVHFLVIRIIQSFEVIIKCGKSNHIQCETKIWAVRKRFPVNSLRLWDLKTYRCKNAGTSTLSRPSPSFSNRVIIFSHSLPNNLTGIDLWNAGFAIYANKQKLVHLMLIFIAIQAYVTYHTVFLPNFPIQYYNIFSAGKLGK